MCVLCSHNCGVRVDVEDNKIVRVLADKSNPITKGYLCSKGTSIGYTTDHAQRVEYPLKRNATGELERISWDQAIAEIAAKLTHLKDTYTGNCLSLIGVAGQANHIDGAYVLTLMRALGSRLWFSALNQEKSQHALVDGWMLDAPATVFFHVDAERSAFILMIGTNPLLSNRGVRARANSCVRSRRTTTGPWWWWTPGSPRPRRRRTNTWHSAPPPPQTRGARRRGRRNRGQSANARMCGSLGAVDGALPCTERNLGLGAGGIGLEGTDGASCSLSCTFGTFSNSTGLW